MPYRVDLPAAAADAFDRLVELGAIDVEVSSDGGIAALLPDAIPSRQVAAALGVDDITVSPAVGRDADSVWVLRPRPARIGRLSIVPAGGEAEAGALRLIDGAAFGTGLHPTTALCLEAIEETVDASRPDSVLDVGTGSGVLAIGALLLGVPRATALDIDAEALRLAGQNARLNSVGERLELVHGGPGAVEGTWPLVVANVLAAPLIEMAPSLVRRVGHQGRLVLSGIAVSVEKDVDRAYRHLGLRSMRTTSRAGWVALVLQATW